MRARVNVLRGSVGANKHKRHSKTISLPMITTISLTTRTTRAPLAYVESNLLNRSSLTTTCKVFKVVFVPRGALSRPQTLYTIKCLRATYHAPKKVQKNPKTVHTFERTLTSICRTRIRINLRHSVREAAHRLKANKQHKNVLVGTSSHVRLVKMECITSGGASPLVTTVIHVDFVHSSMTLLSSFSTFELYRKTK